MPTATLATTDATAPSQVFFGLTRGDMRWVPRDLADEVGKDVSRPNQQQQIENKKTALPLLAQLHQRSHRAARCKRTRRPRSWPPEMPTKAHSRRMAIARKTNGANAAAHTAINANPEVESAGVCLWADGDQQKKQCDKNIGGLYKAGGCCSLRPSFSSSWIASSATTPATNASTGTGARNTSSKTIGMSTTAVSTRFSSSNGDQLRTARADGESLSPP